MMMAKNRHFSAVSGKKANPIINILTVNGDFFFDGECILAVNGNICFRRLLTVNGKTINCR